MKKIVIISFFILFHAIAYAQYGVMGIKFGTSKEQTKSQLEQRFGFLNVRDDNGELTVYDGKFANYTFDFMTFEFAWLANENVFNSAFFQMHFNLGEAKLAKEIRDGIFEKIKIKYTHIEEEINEDGFKYYKFGLNPNDPTKVTGMIDLRRAKGRDNIERLYLTITYFPFYVDLDLDDL